MTRAISALAEIRAWSEAQAEWVAHLARSGVVPEGPERDACAAMARLGATAVMADVALLEDFVIWSVERRAAEDGAGADAPTGEHPVDGTVGLAETGEGERTDDAPRPSDGGGADASVTARAEEDEIARGVAELLSGRAATPGTGARAAGPGAPPLLEGPDSAARFDRGAPREGGPGLVAPVARRIAAALGRLGVERRDLGPASER